MEQQLKQVLMIQEASTVEVQQVDLAPKQVKKLLEEKKVFADLQVTEQEFFSRFALLVDGAAVQNLDVYVDQNAQVVVLPRIIGG